MTVSPEGALSDFSQHIRDFLGSIHEFQGHFEDAYAVLAEVLPELYDSLSALVSTAEELRSGSDVDSLGNISTSIAKLVNTFQASTEAVALLNTEIGSLATNSMEAMSLASSRLGKVDRLGQRLRFTALNASIAAMRVGSGAAAFAALTRNLNELAASGMREARRARDVAERMTAEAESLSRIQTEVNSRLGEVVENAKSTLATTSQATSNTLSGLTERVFLLARQAYDATVPIRTIMLELQQQDILRQGIDHVTLLLQEIEHTVEDTIQAHRPMTRSEVMLVEQALELSVRLLGDILDSINNVHDLIDTHLLTLISTETELEQGQNALEQIDTHQLGVHFEQLTHDLTIIDGALDYLDQHRSTISSGESFCKEVAVSVRHLLSVAEQLALVKVVVAIEISRTPPLRSSSIATEIGAAQSELLTSTSSVSDQVSALEQALTAMSTSLNGRGLVKETLLTLRNHLVDERSRILEIVNLALERIARGLGGARSASNKAKQAQDSLRKLEQQGQALSRVREACQVISKTLPSTFDENPDSPTNLSRATRFREIIERFTVLSHKQLAQSVDASLVIESGDSGGELTLF